MGDNKTMLEALQRNKTHALDITILLGTPGDANIVADDSGMDGMVEPDADDMSNPTIGLGDEQGQGMETDEEKQEREGLDMAPPATELANDPNQGSNPFADEIAKSNYGKGGSMLGKKGKALASTKV